MPNLLFVSIAFPPKNDPECLQTARYFKYLTKQTNWNIDVVTSQQPTLFMPTDASLEKYNKGYRQKIELKIIESKFTNYALRKMGMDKFLFPDSKMTFHWQWKKVISELDHAPSIIYSRSNPMSSAFMAMRLKQHFNCPWVMHLSDPWAISPLIKTHTKQIERSLIVEEELLKKADAVTFTSPQTMNLYTAHYHQYSTKFSVLPNVYDAEDIEVSDPILTNKLRIVYTGGLAGERNVFFLSEVLKKIGEKRPDFQKDIEFIFAGDCDRANKAFFATTMSCIKHLGILSYSQAKQLYKTAHMLLVVDNPTKANEAIFFPSKLLDYFVAQKKIWAVSPEQSTTRDVLQGYNHVAFKHEEIEPMAKFLLQCLEKFKEEDGSFFQASQTPTAYDASINSAKLQDLLKNLVG